MRKRHPCVPPAAPAHVRGTAWLIASGTLGPQDTYHSSTVHNGFFGAAQTLVNIGVFIGPVRFHWPCGYVRVAQKDPGQYQTTSLAKTAILCRLATPRVNSNTGCSGEPGKVAQLLQLRSMRSQAR